MGKISVEKKRPSLRPVGAIRLTDPRGYAYLPKILRKEVNCQGKDEIPFFMDANCVLLIRKDADLDKILKGLEVLKKDLILRASESALGKQKERACYE